VGGPRCVNGCNELPKKTLWTNPGGKRGRDRLKSRRIAGAEEDMGSRNWLAAAQDSSRWQHLLEEAKVQPGL
jgi:hypothetical protein